MTPQSFCGNSADGCVPVLIDGVVSWLAPDSAKLACSTLGALPVPPFESIDDQLDAMGGVA